MALPSIVFNVGCIERVGTTQVTHAESTANQAAQFVAARRVNGPRRQFVLTWGAAPMETIDAVVDLYDRTFGGALPMTFAAPNLEGVFAVRFDQRPSLQWTQNSDRVASVTVRLMEV